MIFIQIHTVFWQHQLWTFIFLLWCFHYLTGAVEVIHSVIGTVFIWQQYSQPLQPSTKLSRLCLLKKLKATALILKIAIAAGFICVCVCVCVCVCLFFLQNYSYSNFCLNDFVWNAGKHLQPTIFLMVSLSIWLEQLQAFILNFITAIAVIHSDKCIVIL